MHDETTNLILKRIEADRFPSSEPREAKTLNERTLCRMHVNEIIKCIYAYKGSDVQLKFDADEESVERLKQCVDLVLRRIEAPSPIERVRRRLFPKERQSRKTSRSQKRNSEKIAQNFVFKAKKGRPGHKVRRDYLKLARINVMQKIHAQKNVHQMQEFCLDTSHGSLTI